MNINYRSRTPEYYLARLSPEVDATLTPTQRQAVHTLLAEAIPRPAPKIVDLRFTVDLLLSRFYINLQVGTDRRKYKRHSLSEQTARLGNLVAALVLLVGTNLVISALIVLVVYLVKSLIGIDLMPGHFPDLIKSLT